MTTHYPSSTSPGRESSLSERYVHAVVRRLPEDQREDVAEELRGSIADRVEALVHERPAALDDRALDDRALDDRALDDRGAEYAALEELGDPDRLAAGYTGRRLQLIGPELYPAYTRVLRAVLVAAVPSVTIVATVLGVLDERSLGGVIGGAVWLGFIVVVQVAFWVTLAFALTERGLSTQDLRSSMNVEWSPDQLPDLPGSPRGNIGELITSLVWIGFIGAAILWQQVDSPLGDGGAHIPVLDPDLWSFWLPLILVLLAVEMLFEVVKYRIGRWTPHLATVNIALGAVFAAPFVYLAASDRLLNPAAVAEVRDAWPEFDPGSTNTLVIVVAVAIWAWSSIDGWRKTRH